jgi:hypothetical protein
LVVLPDQWPRALLRAQLREDGYDAVGARNVEEALTYRPEVRGRGTVRLVLVDGDALEGETGIEDLLARHGNPPAVVLIHATQQVPPGPWARVIRRPESIAGIVSVVRELLPLGSGTARPADG